MWQFSVFNIVKRLWSFSAGLLSRFWYTQLNIFCAIFGTKIPYYGIEVTAPIISFTGLTQFYDHVYFSKPVPLASATSCRASDRVCMTTRKILKMDCFFLFKC